MDATIDSRHSWFQSAMMQRPVSPDLRSDFTDSNRPCSADGHRESRRQTTETVRRKGTGGTGATLPSVQAPKIVEDPVNEEAYKKLLWLEQRDTLDLQEPYEFMFKHRLTTGRAIHVAALHRDGARVLSWLLESKAQVDDPCTTVGEDATTSVRRNICLQPIHLAAGRGNIEAMRALLSAGADPQARTLYDGDLNYCPIHEAAYFMQVGAVRFLLENDADPNTKNMKGQTTLHVASAVGCWRSAQLLVEADADLLAQDEDGHTALYTAINGRYPDRKLHIIARTCITDLMEVAKEAPSAAVELLQDSDAWRRGLMDASQGYPLPTTEHLVALLQIAPKVAGQLLDVLTITPPVEDPYHHPMPRHAKHDMFEFRLCEYTMDTEWKHYQEASMDTGVGDKFRHALSQKKDDAVSRAEFDQQYDEVMEQLGYESRNGRLHIRLLKLPNIVCFQTLNAISRLKTTEEITVFQRSAVQALLDFSWFHIVRLEYTVNLVIKVWELSFLLWVTFSPPTTEAGKRVSWSLLAATATRSVWTELAQVIGYHKYVKSVRTYFENSWNYVDMGTITLAMVLTWGAFDSREFNNRELLAIVSFFRWIQLLYSTGAYRFLDIGYKIVPIFQSFFQVSGIFTITLFAFMAFFHAFAALEKKESINTMEIFLNAFKLLLVGDGDGIQYVLNLGGRPENGEIWTQLFLYFGVLIFCICILNLFIAVHGGAYDAESARVTENFYRNRASICLNTMLQPRWRRGLPLPPLWCYLILMTVALPTWFGLLWTDAHPVISTALLLLSLLVGDAMLRKRPWKEKNGQPWQLWGEEDPTKMSQLKVAPVEPSDASSKPSDSEAAPLTPNRTHPDHHAPGDSTPGTIERTKTPPELQVAGAGKTENDASRADGTPPASKKKGKLGASMPRLKPEMFLWWCSWAEDEGDAECQRKREERGVVEESLKQLNRQVGSLNRRVGQDDRLGKIERQVVALSRNMAENRSAVTESVERVSKGLNSKVDHAFRRFEGLDTRLGGLEGHVAELQRSIVQLSDQLRPVCEAAVATKRQADLAYAAALEARGDAAGAGSGNARGKAKGGVVIKLRDSSASRREREGVGGGGVGAPETAASCGAGGDAGGGGPESVRSGDAGGGGVRSAARGGRGPAGAGGDAGGGEGVGGDASKGTPHFDGLASPPGRPGFGEEIPYRDIVDLTDDGQDDSVRLPADWGA